MLRHIDLFSGIGGFALAARWTGIIQTVLFCEIDDFCQKVLAKNFPGIEIVKDIKQLRGGDYEADIITAGFPCQKYSTAGKRTGNESLKDEMLRVISENQPQWVIVENVGGFINKLFSHEHDALCEYLESLGYETQTFDIDGSSVGLQTLERHVWIVASANGKRREWCEKIKMCYEQIREKKLQGRNQKYSYGRDIRETKFCRVGERVSRKLDRNQRKRVKALGNSIPPDVAYFLLKSIVAIEIGAI